MAGKRRGTTVSVRPEILHRARQSLGRSSRSGCRPCRSLHTDLTDYVPRLEANLRTGLKKGTGRGGGSGGCLCHKCDFDHVNAAGLGHGAKVHRRQLWGTSSESKGIWASCAEWLQRIGISLQIASMRDCGSYGRPCQSVSEVSGERRRFTLP